MANMRSLQAGVANASGLSDYTDGALTGAFTGPFLASQNVAVKLRKIGNLVVLDIAGISATSAAGTIALATSDAFVTASSRPSASVYAPIVVISNSVKINTLGKIEVLSTGVVKIWLDSLETGLFAATGNNGWVRTSIAYSV